MIRGRFVTQLGGVKRPIVNATLVFPGPQHPLFFVQFLVDTGADVTVLGTAEAAKLQTTCNIALASLPKGNPSAGVGGTMETRVISSATLGLGFKSTPTLMPQLTIAEPTPQAPPIPSLLGRDILGQFVLFVDEANNKVRLFTPQEAATLLWNGSPVP